MLEENIRIAVTDPMAPAEPGDPPTRPIIILSTEDSKWSLTIEGAIDLVKAMKDAIGEAQTKAMAISSQSQGESSTD